MRVLALTTYPSTDASRRLRFDPLVAELSKSNEVRVHSIFTERAFSVKNHRVGRLYTAAVVVMRSIRRLGIIATAKYDVVVVHREALPFFTPFAERIASRRAHCSLVDVDDAIYEQPTHGRDWRRWLRDPAEARGYPQIFDVVTVGSPALFHDANGDGRLIDYPTCPPKFEGDRRPGRDVLWTGSASTLVNLEAVIEDTLKVCLELGSRLVVLGAKNVSRLPAHPMLVADVWSAAREEEALSTAAVGIMPLRDTPWDRGKAAYKAVRYLTSGVPSLVSPVGVNAQLAAEFPIAVQVGGTDWAADLRALMQSPPAGEDFDSDVARAQVRYDAEPYVRRIVEMLKEIRR